MGPSSPPPNRGQSPTPIFGPFYCGQMAGCIKMPLGMEVGLSPGNFMLDGTQLPLPKQGTEPPIFGQRLLWPNGCIGQDVTWYGGRPRPRQLCVRWGPSYPQKKGIPTPCLLRPNGWMDQDATGTDVNVGSGDVVLDGPQLPLKGTQPPVFGSCLLWQNGWMDEDATWNGSRPRPRPHCIRRGPSCP